MSFKSEWLQVFKNPPSGGFDRGMSDSPLVLHRTTAQGNQDEAWGSPNRPPPAEQGRGVVLPAGTTEIFLVACG